MKIAVPTKGNVVDSHFGHCDHYTIFTIDDNKQVTDTELYAAPQGCGCKSNVAEILKGKGVDTMLAGNMGQGALNKLNASNINVIRGCSGDVSENVTAFLNQNLKDSGLTCAAHGEGDHQCNH